MPIERLPRGWRLIPAPAWAERLLPMRDGQELLYYDGPLIQTRWSASGEESLWVKFADGQGRERWWVRVLDAPALDRIAHTGSYSAAFEGQDEPLMVDTTYRRQAAQAPRGAPTYTTHHRVVTVRGIPPQDRPSAGPYARDVAEWARAMQRLQQRQRTTVSPLP